MRLNRASELDRLTRAHVQISEGFQSLHVGSADHGLGRP